MNFVRPPSTSNSSTVVNLDLVKYITATTEKIRFRFVEDYIDWNFDNTDDLNTFLPSFRKILIPNTTKKLQ